MAGWEIPCVDIYNICMIICNYDDDNYNYISYMYLIFKMGQSSINQRFSSKSDDTGGYSAPKKEMGWSSKSVVGRKMIDFPASE